LSWKLASDTAVAAIDKYIKNVNVDKYTIVQKKKIFSFSRHYASLGMQLIKDWHLMTDENKNILCKEYSSLLTSALDEFEGKNKGIISNVNERSMMITETLNNAKNLLLLENGVDKKIILDNTFNVSKFIAKEIYSVTGELPILLIDENQRFAWGQHGACFHTLILS